MWGYLRWLLLNGLTCFSSASWYFTALHSWVSLYYQAPPIVYFWVVISITRRSWLGFFKDPKILSLKETPWMIYLTLELIFITEMNLHCANIFQTDWPWKFILLTTRGYSCNVYLHVVYQTVYILKVHCWLMLQYYFVLFWLVGQYFMYMNNYWPHLSAGLDMMQSHPQMFQWLWMYGVCLCNFYLHDWYSLPYMYIPTISVCKHERPTLSSYHVLSNPDACTIKSITR